MVVVPIFIGDVFLLYLIKSPGSGDKLLRSDDANEVVSIANRDE